MKDVRSGALYLLAVGLLALAAAIIYFAVILSNISTTISKELPDVLASINNTSVKIEPIVNEVRQVRKLIPPVLEEVRQVRSQIPGIVDEVSKVRKQIPAVLDEVRKTRPLVPKVLDEVAATRNAVPGMLARGEKMIADAKNIGSEASSGAVTGFFKGIITAPFAIIGGMGEKLFGLNNEAMQQLSEEQKQNIMELGNEVLAMDEVGSNRKWQYATLGLSGVITLNKVEEQNGSLCKELRIQVWKKSKISVDRVKRLCQDGEGKWQQLDSGNQ